MAVLDRGERGRLIRRATQVHAVAVRLGRPAALDPADLAHLLNGYIQLHHQPKPSTSGLTTRPRSHLWTTMRARWHTNQCAACAQLMRQAHQEAALTQRQAADLAEQNRQLRHAAADTNGRLHLLTVAYEALICERDGARWKLRNAQLAERYQRGLSTARGRS